MLRLVRDLCPARARGEKLQWCARLLSGPDLVRGKQVPVKYVERLSVQLTCTGRWTWKTLVVYDPLYGNTEKIARAIGGAISGEVEVVRVGPVRVSDLQIDGLLYPPEPCLGL